MEWEPHLDAMCLHLEALADGTIKKLLVTTPPGTTKTILFDVLFPAWRWTTNPEIRWLMGNNESNAALDASVKCRMLIESDWYQKNWGSKFELTSDQNTKTWFTNDKLGFRTATTTNSKVFGKKGDILGLDDPHDAKKVYSKKDRKSVIDWHDQSFSNRVNSFRDSRRFVVGARTHAEDLQGHLIKRGDYVHLNLAEEFDETRRCVTSIGWSDWRTTNGELLRPKRFGPEEVKSEKLTYGKLGYQAIHNQNPQNYSGGMFVRAKFVLVELRDVPLPYRFEKLTRAWDKAATPGGGDFTCGVLMGVYEKVYWVLDVVRGQWGSGERRNIMDQTAQLDRLKYGDKVKIKIEEEGGSAGKDVALDEVQRMAGYSVRTEKPSGKKIVRADLFAAQVDGGNVRVVAAPWATEYIDEHCLFDGSDGGVDDQVDATSLAFKDVSGVGKKKFAIAM